VTITDANDTNASTPLYLGGGDWNTTVTGNTLTGNGASGASGIKLSGDFYVAGAGALIGDNTISGFLYGIHIAGGSSAPMNFLMSSNTVTASSRSGLDFSPAPAPGAVVPSNGTISNNVSTGSGTFDCLDPSTGPGTSGTANIWVNNIGATSSPLGLCSLLTPPSPSISNLPASGIYGGSSGTLNVSTISDGVTSVSSSTPLVCTASGHSASYVGVGTCTLVAHVGVGTYYNAGTGAAQSFSIGRASPSTPTISNLPVSGIYGGTSGTLNVATTGDGASSVSSSTLSVCTVSGLVATYVGVGTCTLVAHVATGTLYNSANGAAQSFSIGRAAPSTPTISNLPVSGTFGTSSGTLSVATTGDGVKSVTSSTPGVCTISGFVATYVGSGLCTLVAHVATGTLYNAANGVAQTFSVAPIVPGAPLAVTGHASSGSVTVSWSPPLINGGSVVTGYVVKAAPGGATCSTSTLSCTVSGLSNGTKYTFTVRASNIVGPGATSAPSAQLVPTGPVTISPFAYKSSALTAAMKTQIRALAILVKTDSFRTINLAGFTNPPESTNDEKLGLQRALAVANNLVLQLNSLGVHGVTITESYGGSTRTGNPTANRRVVASLSY